MPPIDPLVTKLELRRMERGFSQYAVARAVGLSPKTVATIEAGLHSPSLKTLRKMCKMLDCSIQLEEH